MGQQLASFRKVIQFYYNWHLEEDKQLVLHHLLPHPHLLDILEDLLDSYVVLLVLTFMLKHQHFYNSSQHLDRQ